MMIMENNGEPFMENGEPIISRKEFILTVNRLARTNCQIFCCRSLEING